MYSERGSTVPGAVVWQQDAPASGDVLPDGCMDLIWWNGQVVVAGPDTRAYPVGGGDGCVGIRFPPGMLPGLLGVPAAELRDRRIPLSDLLFDDAADRLADQMRMAARPGHVLERYACELLKHRDSGVQGRRVSAVVSLIMSQTPVAGIADTVGCSERQLHRLSLQCFGYGPKTLDRILRLQRALRLSGRGVPAAQVAVTAGYADQAHLVRDSRRLTGLTFGALTGQAAA
jgi:AraC-like DNA-binding protein